MESTISLYLLNASDVSKAQIDQLKALLNPEQQYKCDSIAKRKRSEFILSRTLLIHAIRQTLQDQEVALDIQERSQLPPLVEIADQHNIQFSISHSKNMIGIAIGQNMNAIGFDLQAIKHFSETQLLSGDAIESARYFCNESQLADLDSYTDNKTLFAHNYTKLWAKKEAYLKALQCGISTTLLIKTSFTKSPDNQGTLSVSLLLGNHNDYFMLALFCERPYTISCDSLELDKLSLITNKSNTPLEWEFFKIKNL